MSVVQGSSVADSLVGTSAADYLLGLAGDDLLSGGSGADTLNGGLGSDTLDGGPGIDYASYSSAAVGVVVLLGGTAAGTAMEGLDTDVLRSVEGVYGSAYGDIIVGSSSAEYIYGEGGNDSIDGGAGATNYLSGGAGDDVITAISGDVVNGGEGNDTVLYRLTGNGAVFNSPTLGSFPGVTYVEEVRIYGTPGADVINAGPVAEHWLQGNGGDDTLAGGTSPDTFAFDVDLSKAANVTITGLASFSDSLVLLRADRKFAVVDLLEVADPATVLSGQVLITAGGAGSTVLEIGTDDVPGADFAIRLQGDYQVDQFGFSNRNDVATLTYQPGVIRVGSSSNDWIDGSLGNDRLDGKDGDDRIDGNFGNDTISGGGGDDEIQYRGSGLVDAGDGNDTVFVDGYGELGRQRIDGGAGYDIVTFSVGWWTPTPATVNAPDNVASLPEAHSELVLVGVEEVRLRGGAGSDTLTGNSMPNVLTGGAGNDTLSGLGGIDSFDFVLDGAVGIDLITDLQPGEFITVHDLFSTALPLSGKIYGERTLSELAKGDVSVGAFHDGITPVWIRYASNDGAVLTIELSGRFAAEQFSVQHAGVSLVLTSTDQADRVVGTSAVDHLQAGAGDDTIQGDNGDDFLSGNDGNDLLEGGAGSDVLEGGAGNDLYIVDNAHDVVIEYAQAGLDTVQSSAAFTLPLNVENLTLTGSLALEGYGNALANDLTGNSGANALYGLAGNDTLKGGAGADTLVGGAGSDRYTVDSPGDVVIEQAGEGYDLIESSTDWTLGPDCEALMLVGAAVVGTGNALNNAITGSNAANRLSGEAGNDTLNGGAGADTMLGGLGSDTYVQHNANDVVIELPAEGYDVVQAYVTATLPANVEQLTLLGTARNGYGNPLNNRLIGNQIANNLAGGDGNDTLDGGLGDDTLYGGSGGDLLQGGEGNDRLDGQAGADQMQGGAGDDWYVCDVPGDSVVELADAGTDTLQARYSATLPAHVEKLVLIAQHVTGTGNVGNNGITGWLGNERLFGLEGDDTLSGGAGNDLLDGGSGNDQLVGGVGNDVLLGGSGADTFVFDLLAGVDTIRDFNLAAGDRLKVIHDQQGGIMTSAQLRDVSHPTPVGTVFELGAEHRIVLLGVAWETLASFNFSAAEQ